MGLDALRLFERNFLDAASVFAGCFGFVVVAVGFGCWGAASSAAGTFLSFLTISDSDDAAFFFFFLFTAVVSKEYRPLIQTKIPHHLILSTSSFLFAFSLH